MEFISHRLQLPTRATGRAFITVNNLRD